MDASAVTDTVRVPAGAGGAAARAHAWAAAAEAGGGGWWPVGAAALDGPAGQCDELVELVVRRHAIDG